MDSEIYINKEYLEKNPNWHVEDSYWKAGNILKIINKNKLSPNTIAEVGVGAGEILLQMQLKLPKYVSLDGYDISPQAIKLCNQRENENLKCHLKDFLSEDTKFYDLVLAIDVFEHVDDYIGFIKNLKRKGINQIFHIPLDLSVQTVFRGTPLKVQRELVGHIHYFTKDTALETLRYAGCEVIDYFYTATAIELPPKTLKAKLANIPRKILFNFWPDFTVRLLGGYSLMVLTK